MALLESMPLLAYMIYIRHTSFQLYHSQFSQKYLQILYNNGALTTSEEVSLYEVI